MPTQPPHERLDAFMSARAAELGIGWEELAVRAGTKYETIRAIRRGRTRGRPLTRRSISLALQWTPGSIDRIFAGGDPEEAPGITPAAPAATTEDAERRAVIAGVRALYPGDQLAEHIMTQWHKPLETRQRELDAVRAVRGQQQALQVTA